MTLPIRRTPPLLDAKILQMDPLTQWWHHEDAVCVALRSVQHTPVLTVGGTLDERAVDPCRLALEAALRARPRRVLVDLASVSSCAAAGTTLLPAMRRAAAWHGSEVWLAGVPEQIRSALGRFGLLTDFPIARNVVRALEEMRRRDRPTTRTA